MNLGEAAAQSAAPIVAKIFLEDDSLRNDNALENELARARGSLPTGSCFSISSCSSSQFPWEYISRNPASSSPIPDLEAVVERTNLLVTSLFSKLAELVGVTNLLFKQNPKEVQKWIVLVKNASRNTTIGKTDYLSALLRRCAEENCILIRIDSSNPHKITGLVDGTTLSGAFCARMERSPWGWLSEKTREYVAEMKRAAGGCTGAAGAAQSIKSPQSDQTLEAELLAIAKGIGD